MKKYYIFILIFSISTLWSCNNFLDVPSRENVEGEENNIYSPEQLLTGVYGQFCDWDYGFSYLGITSIISDNADKGSAPSDPGGDKAELSDLTYTSSSGSFLSMWTRWYKTIGIAGQSIEYTKESQLQDKTLEARYIAEARYLRALNYFFLVRGWGEIPIQEIDDIKRQPISDVYDYIIADLEYAEKNLPTKSDYAYKDLGRATKGAAQGLMAKVYLYQKKFQDAYNYADNVIKSNQYSLMQNYADVFKPANSNNSESIFEFQAKSATESSVAQGVKQYSQTQGARGGDNPWGWGFNSPSQNLLDAYNNAGDNERRDATIIFENSTLYDGRTIGATENPRYNYKAYTPVAPNADYNNRNVMYMRYSEILLIKAEAANELGKTNEALNALNQVRKRVNLSEIKETNQEVLRQIIWDERRLELAMEHDRWFDLIRTGQAERVMLALGKPFTNKNWLFPIPNNVITQTPNIEQNVGW